MYDHHLYFGLQIILFHTIYSLLFNHDFFTIHDVQTLLDLSLCY